MMSLMTAITTMATVITAAIIIFTEFYCALSVCWALC